MTDVLLATCAALASGDEDAALLLLALHRHGIEAKWAVWDDAHVDWDASLVVLRSTWDYAPRLEEFRRWVDGLARVANPAEIVRWNTDKTYLADLAAAGLASVPTSFAPPGRALTFPPAGLPPAGEYVVKPSVGAGSRGAGRFTADRVDAAREHAAALHAAGRTVVVQPYLDAVDTAGETALVYVDGTFSHAVRKGPMLPPGVTHPVDGWQLYVEEAISAREPTDAELRAGEEALGYVQRRFGVDPLYARVDLLRSADGPVLLEVELTEPSLFLDAAEKAADAFATAIAGRL